MQILDDLPPGHLAVARSALIVAAGPLAVVLAVVLVKADTDWGRESFGRFGPGPAPH